MAEGYAYGGRDSEQESDDEDLDGVSDLQAVLELKSKLQHLGSLNEAKKRLTVWNQLLERTCAATVRKYGQVQEELREKQAKEAEAAARLEATQRRTDAVLAKSDQMEEEIREIKEETKRIKEQLSEMKRDSFQKRAAALEKKRSQVQDAQADIANKKQAILWIHRDRAKLASSMAKVKEDETLAAGTLQQVEGVAPEVLKLVEAIAAKGTKMTKAERSAYQFLKMYVEFGGRQSDCSSDEDMSEVIKAFEVRLEAIKGGYGPLTSSSEDSSSFTDSSSDETVNGEKDRARKRV